jgi:hypothetical protein
VLCCDQPIADGVLCIEAAVQPSNICTHNP